MGGSFFFFFGGGNHYLHSAYLGYVERLLLHVPDPVSAP